MQASARVIINDIKKRPENWHVDQFTARHQSGLEVWLGNGFLGLHVKKPELKEFGIWDRFRLYRALKPFQKTGESTSKS